VAAVAAALRKFLGTPRKAAERPPVLDTLIATILSQNTSETNSHRAYSRLRERYPTWADVAGAPLRGLIAALRPGGMARQKAVRLKSLLSTLRHPQGGFTLDHLASFRPDRAMDELLRFDGVGPKTAACVLLFSLGHDIFPVDTHIHRICGRLGLARECPTPEKTFHAMAPLIPPGEAYTFHVNLIRFGRSVCRARDPLCGVCPLYARCRFPDRSKRREAVVRLLPSNSQRTLLEKIQA
jgi:endonuclease-3